ncbi:MAG TPA: hypothetical protein VK506_05345, partial [Conexibacter sp.]|nr:hypothetical protein [Conexibacter sp.]
MSAPTTDRRAQRTAAEAELARATAESAVTWADVETRMIEAQARAEQLGDERAAARRAREDERREEARRRTLARKAEAREAARARRAALSARLRSVLGLAPILLQMAVCLSPTAIAWRGQERFAAEFMGLGGWSWTFPAMLEGAAWVLVLRRLVVLRDPRGLPTARLTGAIWAIATTAASMNYWHESARGIAVGVAFALASVLGFVLVEIFAGEVHQARAGWTAGAMRLATLRWLRFPLLSWHAWSDALARGGTPEARAEAWERVWRAHYGVGVDASGAERRLARRAHVLARREELKAVKKGRV